MCIFVGPYTRRRGDLTDRFPMRKVRPFLCLVGRFYLHFELSPSYARDSSQGLRESPAILVLTVRKIHHTHIGSVLVVLWPTLFSKWRGLKTLQRLKSDFLSQTCFAPPSSLLFLFKHLSPLLLPPLDSSLSPPSFLATLH
jgi:hypothetical protein